MICHLSSANHHDDTTLLFITELQLCEEIKILVSFTQHWILRISSQDWFNLDSKQEARLGQFPKLTAGGNKILQFFFFVASYDDKNRISVGFLSRWFYLWFNCHSIFLYIKYPFIFYYLLIMPLRKSFVCETGFSLASNIINQSANFLCFVTFKLKKKKNSKLCLIFLSFSNTIVFKLSLIHVLIPYAASVL